MSIIAALRNWITSYTGLADDAPVWVNYLGPIYTEYAIIPLPGAKIIETDIVGRTTREYPFAFQSMESTADDVTRLGTSAFYEEFAAWLEEQSEAGALPNLATGKLAVAVEATTGGYLFEQGGSQTSIYQINCRLIYVQEP